MKDFDSIAAQLDYTAVWLAADNPGVARELYQIAHTLREGTTRERIDVAFDLSCGGPGYEQSCPTLASMCDDVSTAIFALCVPHAIREAR